MDNLGEKLRKARLQNDLMQKTVVKMLNDKGVDISQSHLSKIENNERVPRVSIITTLCELYGIEVSELLGSNKVQEVKQEPKPKEEPALARDEQALLSNYRRLDDYDKKIVKHMAQYLSTNDEFPLNKRRDSDDLLIAAHGSEGADEEEKARIRGDIEKILREKQ